jgi:hypothetical protein
MQACGASQQPRTELIVVCWPCSAQVAANKQYLYQFVLHASLDAVDDIVWTTNSMYLKVWHHHHQQWKRVGGWVAR